MLDARAERIEQLEKEVRALRLKLDWQPIDTIPKPTFRHPDDSNYGPEVVCKGAWYTDPTSFTGANNGFKPTHWAYLPVIHSPYEYDLEN